MNKSKIEWCDYTWNPVTGCLHNCDYCYARRIAERFGLKFAPKLGDSGMEGACKYDSPEGMDTMLELEKPYTKNGRIQPYPMAFLPTFHRYRLDEPQKLKKPSKIFVSSMGDLFGEWVPDEWIKKVYSACQRADHHTYIFLTKNPKNYSKVYRNELDYRCNMWFGTTITNTYDMSHKGYDLFCNTGDDSERAARRFLSMEPLLSEIDKWSLENIQYMNWIIVGAQTGPGAKLPKPEWVQSIINQCRAAGVPVFLKNNLNWPEKIQEWPEGM